MAGKESLRISARVIAVEILVHIKDEVGDGAVGVSDVQQGWSGSVGDKGLSRGPVVSGE